MALRRDGVPPRPLHDHRARVPSHADTTPGAPTSESMPTLLGPSSSRQAASCSRGNADGRAPRRWPRRSRRSPGCRRGARTRCCRRRTAPRPRSPAAASASAARPSRPTAGRRCIGPTSGHHSAPWRSMATTAATRGRSPACRRHPPSAARPRRRTGRPPAPGAGAPPPARRGASPRLGGYRRNYSHTDCHISTSGGPPWTSLRTPDDRFADLPGFPFEPHYVGDPRRRRRHAPRAPRRRG